MKCPKDDHILKSENFHGVNAHQCPTCKGLWFDHDELKKAKDNTDDDLRWLNFDMFEEREGKFHASPGTHACPADGTKMVTRVYDHSKVAIDGCHKCHGVWLDRDEYEKIIKYLHEKIYSETSGEYSVDLFNQLLEFGSAKESALSELKDFAAVARLLETRYEVEHPWIIGLNQFLYVNLPFK